MSLDPAMHMSVEIVEPIEPFKPDDIRSIFPEIYPCSRCCDMCSERSSAGLYDSSFWQA